MGRVSSDRINIIENKPLNVQWKHPEVTGHKTAWFHGKDPVACQLLIHRCPILEELRDAFKVFADELDMINETLGHTIDKEVGHLSCILEEEHCCSLQ